MWTAIYTFFSTFACDVVLPIHLHAQHAVLFFASASELSESCGLEDTGSILLHVSGMCLQFSSEEASWGHIISCLRWKCLKMILLREKYGRSKDPSFALQTAETDTQAMQQNATNIFLLPRVDTSASQPLLSAASTEKVDLPNPCQTPHLPFHECTCWKCWSPELFCTFLSKLSDLPMDLLTKL